MAVGRGTDHRSPADDVRRRRRGDREPAAVAQQLAATLAHVVIGRVVPLLVLEGRAWDTGLENLWVHVDSEGAIDWVGVVDPTLRALPDDPFFGARDDRAARRRPHSAQDGIVALPSEAALTTWIAHRSHRALEPLFGKLADVSDGAMSVARCGTSSAAPW